MVVGIGEEGCGHNRLLRISGSVRVARAPVARISVGCITCLAGGSGLGEASGKLPRHPRRLPTTSASSFVTVSMRSGDCANCEQELSGREGRQEGVCLIFRQFSIGRRVEKTLGRIPSLY